MSPVETGELGAADVVLAFVHPALFKVVEIAMLGNGSTVLTDASDEHKYIICNFLNLKRVHKLYFFYSTEVQKPKFAHICKPHQKSLQQL